MLLALIKLIKPIRPLALLQGYLSSIAVLSRGLLTGSLLIGGLLVVQAQPSPAQAQGDSRSSRKLNALENRLKQMKKDLGQVIVENNALRETIERIEIEALRSDREWQNTLKSHANQQVLWRDELDKLRLQITMMEQLLTSPLAGVPDVTAADKLWRRGLSQLFNGQLDLAVRDLVLFRRHYPKDARLVQGLHYQGQALFLLRQCEGAMEPLFTLLKEQPKYRRISDVRWLLARCLEDVGEPLRARRFYAELVASGKYWADDAAGRLEFLDEIYGKPTKK